MSEFLHTIQKKKKGNNEATDMETIYVNKKNIRGFQ